MSKVFHVMWGWPISPAYKKLGCPKTLPWAFIEPHERQAYINHGQTLQRLNERGGLDVVELRAVLEGKSWRDVSKDETSAIQKLISLLRKWEEEIAVPRKSRHFTNEAVEAGMFPKHGGPSKE